MQKNQGLTMEKREVWVRVSGCGGCWRERMNTVGGWWVLDQESATGGGGYWREGGAVTNPRATEDYREN